jgi:hypothetical protein
MAVVKNGIFVRYNGEIITPQSLGIDYTGIEKCKQFFNSGSISDEVQQYAVYRLVGDLQTYGIWDKMKAIYPFVGQAGVSTSFEFNLKDPNTFRSTFSAGWNFASTGVTPNGEGAFCNTNVPWADLLRNNNSIGFYSRTNIIATQIDMGVADKYRIWANYTGLGAGGSNFSSFTSVINSDSLGFYQNIRVNSSTFKIYKNNSILTTANIASSVDAHPTQKIAIGGQMLENNTGVQNPSSKEFAFAYLGDGLTDTEAANFYTAVQRFQTTLGRQV